MWIKSKSYKYSIMKILNIKLTFLLLLFAGFVCSCDEFKDSKEYSGEEFVKNLDGSWYISKVSRNGIDITNLMDFSAFRISFNADKTYKIDNYLPFLVKKDGVWTIDDPQYPTSLILKEDGAQNANTSAFEYTIVGGERQISLSFSPGCRSNIYTYVLERASN